MAKCFSCGIETPLALRLPGRWSDLASDKRGRLPYCADHEDDALARRSAKINVTRSGSGSEGNAGVAVAGSTEAPRHGADAPARKRNARERGINPDQGSLL